MKTIDDYTISDIRALINDRDALVAMNAELVEALENIASPSIYDCEDGHCMSEMANAALTKAKRIG